MDSSTIYFKGRGEVGITSGIWLGGGVGEGLKCLLSTALIMNDMYEVCIFFHCQKWFLPSSYSPCLILTMLVTPLLWLLELLLTATLSAKNIGTDHCLHLLSLMGI